MPTRYHNIDGSTGVDVELLAPGSGVNNINAIIITNRHATADATISLFIQDNPTSGTTKTFYILHTVALPADCSLLLDNKNILSFSNSTTTGFGLYTTVGSSDVVDIIIK